MLPILLLVLLMKYSNKIPLEHLQVGVQLPEARAIGSLARVVQLSELGGNNIRQ